MEPSEALDAGGRHERVKEWLDEVVELAAKDRPAALRRMSREDAEAAAEVESLLRAFSRGSEDLLRAPRSDPRVDIGRTLGPYTLRGVLGEGGTACVFRATQTVPIEREVALKVLRPEARIPELAARFEQERSYLARLDHPGIARVLDAGEDDGIAYLAIELVAGDPVTEFADRERLSLSERVRLVADTACSVQHAHGRGILHRDLKPTNILVTRAEGGLRAKVIDFGVAKLLGREGDVGPLKQTRAGQIVGTLEYMSPEQAGFGDGVVDARTDVFALALVLYELITGDLPARVTRPGAAGVAEFLKDLEHGEPAAPRPFAAIVDLPQSAIADVGSVVQKALRREPRFRYTTMDAFADDLRRALNGHAVSARPMTRRYLLARFVRRNRAPVAVAAVAVLSLLTGLVGVVFGLQRAQSNARELGAALEESEAVTDAYARLILGARADRLGPETPLRDVAAAAAAEIEADEGLGPAVRGRLAAAAGEALLDLEDRRRARELLELAERLLAPLEPRAGRLRVRRAVAQRLGLIAVDLGDVDAAQGHYERALELNRAEPASDEGTRRRNASLEARLGVLLDERGDSMAAIELQRRALERVRALAPDDDLAIATERASLAITLYRAGAYAEAEEEARRALEVRSAVFPADDVRVNNTARVLASSLARQGRTAEALQVVEGIAAAMSVDAEDPRALMMALWIASTRHGLLASEESAAELAAAAGAARPLGEGSPRLADMLRTRAFEADLARGGSPEGAARIVADMEERIGADHPDVVRARIGLGRALLREGHRAAAVPLLERARAALLEQNSSPPPLAEELQRLIGGEVD